MSGKENVPKISQCSLVIPFDRDILCEVQFPKATQECTLYNYISNLYCITPFTLSK